MKINKDKICLNQCVLKFLVIDNQGKVSPIAYSEEEKNKLIADLKRLDRERFKIDINNR